LQTILRGLVTLTLSSLTKNSFLNYTTRNIYTYSMSFCFRDRRTNRWTDCDT